MALEEVYTVEEVATLFKVDPMTVRRWIKRKLVLGEDVYRPGKEYRITARGLKKLCGETSVHSGNDE